MIKKITTGRFAGKYLVRTSTRDQLGHRKFSPRKYVDTLEEAKIIESEDRIAFASGYQAANASMALWRYFEQWYLGNVEPYLETNSKSNYNALIKRLRIDLPGKSLKFFDGNKSAVQLYFNELGKKYSISTVNKYRSFLSKAFSDAEYDGLIRKTPMPKESLIRTTGTDKGKFKPVASLSIENAAKLRRYFYENVSLVHQEYLILLIMLECGLRPSEAKALTFDDLNRFSHELHVHNTYVEQDTAIKPYTKTRSERHVPVSPELEKLILSFSADKKKRLAAYNVSNEHNLMFRNDLPPTSRGDRLLSSSANTIKVLRRALDAVDIPDTTREGLPITPKTLRATHDTILIQKGISLDYIARTSGHTVKVIHKYYHALLEEVSNKEADKVKSIWG
ncbi:site-specific integrase [uncultured Leuconostoc sp.]|uniref:tyrosine-type recombinase/integrase n=1 Tax=uncultured Leuconostoc sp. TaxID=173262 RepID=UPI002585D983|nr:site-specific integrase [uncultured Leuconostoc sp.]